MNLSFKAQLSEAKERIIKGYATTESWDRQGEKLPLEVAKKAFARFAESPKICKLHGREEFGRVNSCGCGGVGEFLGHEAADNGILISVRITSDETWGRIEKGEYNGFSIGGYSRAKDGVITDLELVEISLVGIPVNGDCVFLTAKGGVKMDEELKNMLKEISAGVTLLCSAKGDAMSEMAKGDAMSEMAKGDAMSEMAKGNAMVAEIAALKECAAKQAAEIASFKSAMQKLEDTPAMMAKGAAFDTASEGSKTDGGGRKMSEVPYKELVSMTLEQRGKLVNDIA